MRVLRLLCFFAFIIVTLCGPSGTLNTPVNGSVWNNTDGVGLGRVQYQGVDVSNDGPPQWRIRTFSLDISLRDTAATTIYYLARGIRPDPASILVDYEFRIPYTSGAYLLVVEETQQIFMDIETNYTRAYTYVSAAPNITITSGTPASKRNIPPTRSQDAGHAKRQAQQPLGQLLKPAGDISWNNTDGFGSGEVQYQGVNVDYSDGPVTHISTLAVDIWLEVGTNPPYYFAKGIVPNNGETVDATFHIPPYLNGTYGLNINDMRLAQDPALPELVWQTGNPALYITMAEPWLILATVNATGYVPGCEVSTVDSDSSRWPISAIVVVTILGTTTLIFSGTTIYGFLDRIAQSPHKRPRSARRDSDLVGDVPTSPVERSTHIISPFLLEPHPTAASGPSTEIPPPPSYTRKSMRPPYTINNR